MELLKSPLSSHEVGEAEPASPTSSSWSGVTESIKVSDPGSIDVNPTAVDPGKAKDDFRKYEQKKADGWAEGVRNHYRLMRTNQTVAFVNRMEKKWFGLDRQPGQQQTQPGPWPTKARMTIREAFDGPLKSYVDSSDPDTQFPNMEHMLQTAEAIRRAGRPDWMQLIGLVHDMGKIMFQWGCEADGQVGTAAGPQFALGGDTWVVGCALPDAAMVLPEFNHCNPDMQDERYSTPNGVYTPGCGIMNLMFAFGHDEYMYRMVQHNKCPFPEEGLAMLRLHSCYPWHRGGAYRQFMAPDGSDQRLMDAVLDFNQFDLYTKADSRPDVDALWPYYQALIDKYMPGQLEW